MKQNTSVLGKLILSLAYRYSLATLYASTLRSTDRRNASPPRPQNHPHVYHPHGMSPSHIYTMRFLYYYEFDLATMVGSTPSNVFVTRPNRTRIAFRHTRATWMRPVMISLGIGIGL